jgi:hypothetical protein
MLQAQVSSIQLVFRIHTFSTADTGTNFLLPILTSRERRPNLNPSLHAIVCLAIVNIGLDRTITFKSS